MSSMNERDWAKLWVPIAVELIRDYLLPLIFGKKTTKREKVLELKRSGVGMMGVEMERVRPSLLLVKVDEKKVPIRKVRDDLNSLSESSGLNTQFLVVGKGVKMAALSDRALKKAGLRRA